MPTDYPDGFRRNLPGHTVDMEAGFSLPWCESTSLVIAAAGNSSFTVKFSSLDWIYFVDMINVTPQAYTEFYVSVAVNGVLYTAGANMGFLIIPLRTNPSINFINGDSISVTVTNKDASSRTFKVMINGSKILRPSAYGKAPGAYYTATPLCGFAPLSVAFTDGSSCSPTSWEWKANGSSVDSTEQNPTISIVSTGLISPILKATNQYGYDTYARASYIRSLYCIPTSFFTEVDPGGYISLAGDVVTITNIIRGANCYVYHDYGADYFDGYELYADFVLSSCDSTGAVVILAVSTSPAGTPEASSTSVMILVYNDSGTRYLYVDTYTNTTLSAWARVAVSLNTHYYLKVVHYAGSNDVYLYVYSDPTFTTLVSTINTSHASNATKKRYFYSGGSQDAGSGSSTASAVIYKRAIIIP